MVTANTRDTTAALLGGVAALLLLASVAAADARALRVAVGPAPSHAGPDAGPDGAHGKPPASAGLPRPAGDTSASFTLGELAAGEVDPVRYDAFWAAQRDAILSAPCPGPRDGAGTRVTVHVGADERWSAALEAASRVHARRCGDG